MRIIPAILAASLAAMCPSTANAEAVCYKPRLGNDPTPAGTRACRLNAIFDEWLAAHNVETEWWLQIFDRIDVIADNRVLFDVYPMKPWARVEVYFNLSKEESIAAQETIRFRPGFFDSLETALRSQAKEIICETVSGTEEAFIAAGGEIVYNIGLRPSVFDHRTPDWFVKIEISEASCEVP